MGLPADPAPAAGAGPSAVPPVDGAPGRRARLARAIAATDAAVRASPGLRRTALVAGAIFVVASTPKFAAPGWERDAFVRFGLPAPGAMVLLAGVLELAGGALLLARRAVVPSALVLAATMVVATVSGGLVGGDVIPSLTLAPALLVATVALAVVAVRRASRG
jgi:uncharacterized membrane protein YphA (DoxX/SURF4 family)